MHFFLSHTNSLLIRKSATIPFEHVKLANAINRNDESSVVCSLSILRLWIIHSFAYKIYGCIRVVPMDDAFSHFCHTFYHLFSLYFFASRLRHEACTLQLTTCTSNGLCFLAHHLRCTARVKFLHSNFHAYCPFAMQKSYWIPCWTRVLCCAVEIWTADANAECHVDADAIFFNSSSRNNSNGTQNISLLSNNTWFCACS